MSFSQYSDNLYLLIGAFNPLALTVITDLSGLILAILCKQPHYDFFSFFNSL